MQKRKPDPSRRRDNALVLLAIVALLQAIAV